MNNEIDIEVFRNAVIEQRSLYCMSRRVLADRCGVSEATIKRLEVDGNVTLKTYLRISKELCISINIYYDGLQ